MYGSNASTRMSSYGNYSSRPQHPAVKDETKKEKAASSMYLQQTATATTTNNQSIGSIRHAVTMKSCSSTSKIGSKRHYGRTCTAVICLYQSGRPWRNCKLLSSSNREADDIYCRVRWSSGHSGHDGGILRRRADSLFVLCCVVLCCVVLELLATMEPEARKTVNEMEWSAMNPSIDAGSGREYTGARGRSCGPCHYLSTILE